MAMVAPAVVPASTASELLPTIRVTLMAAEVPPEVVSSTAGANRVTVEIVIAPPGVRTVPPRLSSATAEVLKFPFTVVISSAASPSCVRRFSSVVGVSRVTSSRKVMLVSSANVVSVPRVTLPVMR